MNIMKPIHSANGNQTKKAHKTKIDNRINTHTRAHMDRDQNSRRQD